MEETYIRLTHAQRIALRPLWIEVDNAFHDNKKGGVIAMQLRQSDVVNCIFVPHEQAKKIKEILKELE